MFNPLNSKRNEHDTFDDVVTLRVGQRVRSTNKGRRRKGRIITILNSLYEVKWDGENITTYCGERSITPCSGSSIKASTDRANESWWEAKLGKSSGRWDKAWKPRDHMSDIEDLLNDAKGG